MTSDQPGRPVFVVAPPCAGTRSLLRLLAPAGLASGRVIEGSAQHALRIAELQGALPGARFVYLHRDPIETLAAAFEGWRSGVSRTRDQPPGWSGPAWSYTLVPGWQQLNGRPLAEIVVEQWLRVMRPLLAAVASLPADRWCVVLHERLVADAHHELQRLSAFLDLAPWTQAASFDARPTAPEKPAAELVPYLHRVTEVAAGAAAWIA